MEVLKDKKILVGICGGIALYKTCDFIRRLKSEGAELEVVLTTCAQKFASPLLFSALAQAQAYTNEDFFKPSGKALHIELANKVDLVVIIPATADFMAKAAAGIADELLLSVLLATKAPVIFFPAMNTKMFEHPITQRNVEVLKQSGYMVYEPEEGALACGESGKGRLPDVSIAVEALKAIFLPKDFKGRRILITGGPTKEYIDDVRFITNDSSGKMAMALLKEAYYRGAEVDFVKGPMKTHFLIPDLSFLNIPFPRVWSVETTKEMYEAASRVFPDVEVAIFAAAPVDFKPDTCFKGKLKKEEVKEISLELTPDIALELGCKKVNQITVGFALEPKERLKELALVKKQNKNFDIIIANSLETMGSEKGDFLVITEELTYQLKDTSKSQLARFLFDLLGSYVQRGSSSK